jgi:hypothetical protein
MRRGSITRAVRWLCDFWVWVVLIPWRCLVAILKLVFEVNGGAPVEVTATPLDPLPLVLPDLVPGTVRFGITNPLDRTITLPVPSVTLSGTAAGKAVAGIDNPAPITIGPRETVDISVTVTPQTLIFEGETLMVSVTAKE